MTASPRPDPPTGPAGGHHLSPALAPYHADDRVVLYRGNALAVLAGLPAGLADAVITDPPYSSGGMVRGDRLGSTRVKYTGRKNRAPESLEFCGDARDGRGWAYWMALWLAEALRVTRPGGVLGMFCDWRQLPGASDALQAGGWVWRGIIPWRKPDPRPQLGRFASACEYVVWGTAGPRPLTGRALPGFFEGRAPRGPEKTISTQKPVSVLQELVRIAPPGGWVLDPFTGSGTTGVAAVLEGRRFVGAEIVGHHAEIAADRITTARQSLDKSA